MELKSRGLSGHGVMSELPAGIVLNDWYSRPELNRDHRFRKEYFTSFLYSEISKTTCPLPKV